jgi:hypothetical protein
VGLYIKLFVKPVNMLTGGGFMLIVKPIMAIRIWVTWYKVKSYLNLHCTNKPAGFDERNIA